ncbi:uncharacterized protein LOC109716220 [Ananas comosus]|uniref:Uncharacterized protein LOC109716220 n=1 Tax=Ananas comosus TaxID=4615 RepID=A0A6P5FLF9_ANACO|nr:uncharacterized protein LOC109716220 [Ananas comosus]
MDTLEVGWSLPLKRAAPTAKEDVEQFFKKPKVETQLVQPKSKYKPISLDDFDTCLRNIEEWLPEDVSLAMELERGCNDAYQLLRIRGQNLWNTDYFERMLQNCEEQKNYEEQRLYLKFYVQLSKEVKEGESWKDVCKRLAVGVEGDLSKLKKEMAIVDYFANRIEEVRVKERYELFCHILDEVIMNKDFATVVAKIIEDNLYPDLHDEIRKCQKKSFVMDLKEHCQYGMHIDEAREHIKTAFFETWKINVQQRWLGFHA